MINLQTSNPQPKLTVWYGPMPESDGKTNWTALLHRADEPLGYDGHTIDRSEYPDRVRYEADRVRYLIGELEEMPDILTYGADKHSGYVEQPNYKTQRDLLLAVTKALLTYCEDLQDEGPTGSGWKSENLAKCICEAEGLIARCEGN